MRFGHFSWLGFKPTDPMNYLLRERAKAARASAARERPDASVHAARLFLDHMDITDHDVVALYSPINTELNTQPLTSALQARGIKTALPVVIGKNKPLIFRTLTSETILERGKFGASIPGADMAEMTPTIVVTPLLAFSRTGDRIGYGGGYYDRTLAHLRAKSSIRAIGYAYGAQEVDALTTHKLDQPLDYIITEREVIRVPR